MFGTYTPDMKMTFTKQYIGQHAVLYAGDIDTESESNKIILTGLYDNGVGFREEAQFRFDIPFKKNHVMLSYQWGCQSTIKLVATFLAKRGIPIWFDINGKSRQVYSTCF